MSHCQYSTTKLRCRKESAWCRSCFRFTVRIRYRPGVTVVDLTCDNRKKLQFITLLTAIVHCFTHRKQQKW